MSPRTEKRRVTFIGEIGVGKSSVIDRFVDGSFELYYEPTVGVDYKCKTVRYIDRDVRLQLWDCAGKDLYQQLTETYISNSDAVVIVCDGTYSFRRARERYAAARALVRRPCSFFLVLNKTDRTQNESRNAASRAGTSCRRRSALRRQRG